MNSCIFFTSGTHFNDEPCLSLEKKNVVFHLFFKSKKMVLIDLWNRVSHVFYFYVCSQKWKMVIFKPVPYTLYLVHEAMGIFYIIHRCHQVSFLACLHPMDLHCHKPHQKAFLLPKKDLVYFFNYLCGVFWYTVFHILFFTFFLQQPKKKVDKNVLNK